MTTAIFDKLLELRAVTAGAVVATGSTTGVLLRPRFLPTCDWVIHVTAIDAATGDETYVFTLEVSDLVGGTYTAIATHNWPRARGVGKVHLPINGHLAAMTDADSQFMRVTATLAAAGSSITYGSYLAQASDRAGIADKMGGVAVMV